MTTSQVLTLVAAGLFLVAAVVPGSAKVPVNLGWLGAVALSIALFLQWGGAGG